MKPGDLVRDIHTPSLGVGILLREPFISWDWYDANGERGGLVCEAFWSKIGDAKIRRVSWVEKIE